jgi:tricorn protease
VIVEEREVIDYEWSPDSKWLCYARLDGHFASELYIVPAGGPTAEHPPRNITRYATYNGGVTWSKTGNKLAFVSARRATPTHGLCVLSLHKPAAPDAKADGGIDWEDIHLRVQQPTAMRVLAAAISGDGKKVAFRSPENGDDLWVAAADGSQINRLTFGNMRPTQLQWLNQTIYFRDAPGQLRSVPAAGGFAATVPFQARLTINRDEEFAEMFEQSWRAIHENFYDPTFHGADWNALRAKYRPLVKHVALKEDLYALISLMLGELNASHLNIYGFIAFPVEATADLGLRFDDRYRGPGLLIAEVLKRGPADLRGLNLKAGDIVWRIDSRAVSENFPLAKLLNGKIGQTVVLEVSAGAPAKDRRRVELKAGSRARMAQLAYERWVEKNAKRVAELSKGRLGYIHIPDMQESGLDRFTRALYSDNFGKDGIVLDVRYNGGGYTHESVLKYLGGKDHTFFQNRHGGAGSVLNFPDRRWSKPLVLLMNNRSYSDAEIFPSAFRAMGLGKLVGQPTAGHVIGTRNMQLIDGSTFRVPRIGAFTHKGVNMEKEGVAPDVLVEPHPDQLARGLDAQLDRAVEVLQKDVAGWKKGRDGVASFPRLPAVPVVGPGPVPAPRNNPKQGPPAHSRTPS